MNLLQTKYALAQGLKASFGVDGGTAPYTYSVVGGGAGGTIDPTSGLYTAPAIAPVDPTKFFDTIVATDSAVPPVTAQSTIEVGNPWMLLMDVISRSMKIDRLKQIWFQNQKQQEPIDATVGMWVVLMFPNLQVYGSGLHPAGTITDEGGPGWDVTEKWANFTGPVDIHLISRDLSALNRKEELVMALTGPYSRSQQEANSFYIARIPHNIVDISGIDGAAIPWHFVVSVELKYGTSRTFGSNYFDQVPKPQIVVNQ